MSERFAPIPYSALAAAGPHGRLAVLDLFTRAHTNNWRPFRATDRDLAEAWGVDRRRVTSIVDGLIASGHITVSRVDKWSAREFNVHAPYGNGCTSNGTSNGTSAVPFSAPDEMTVDTASSEDAAPATAPATAPASVPTRAEEDTRTQNRTEPNLTEPKVQTEKAKRVKPTRELPLLIVNAYADTMGGIGLRPVPCAPECDGILARLAAGAKVADIIEMLCWLATGTHDRAVFLRKGGLVQSKTPWRPSNFEEYLGFARLPQPARGGEYRRDANDVLPVLTEVDDDLPF